MQENQRQENQRKGKFTAFLASSYPFRGKRIRGKRQERFTAFLASIFYARESETGKSEERKVYRFSCLLLLILLPLINKKAK